MKKIYKGQVALVMLLVSAVVMTIGLSVSKRSTVETKVDTDEQLLKQAFNAAEGGIEYYLRTGETTYTATDNNSSAVINPTNIGGGTTINFEEFTANNDTVFYWLVGHNTDGTINYGSAYAGSEVNVCVNNTFTGSLKIDYFYRTAGGVYEVWRGGNNFGGTTVNGYTDSTGVANNSCTGVTGYKQINLPVTLAPNTPLLVAVKPIFSGTRLIATGNGNFPIQGVNISATGRAGAVGSGAAASTNTSGREIRISSRYEVPGFMLETITAGNSVLSN